MKKNYYKEDEETFEDKINKIKPEKLEEWTKEQFRLSKLIIEDNSDKDFIKNIKFIGGLDISFSKHHENKAYVGIVIMNIQKKIVYEKYEKITMKEPYVPSYLAFREVDFYLKLIEEVKSNNIDVFPDVLLLDGNGIMHPRHCGIAVHLGVLTNIPTIGCAKTVYALDGITANKVEQYSTKLTKVGQYIKLKGNTGKVWGCMLKSSQEDEPLIVSQGHLINLDTSIDVVLKMLSGYLTPEPIYTADKTTRKKIYLDDKEEKYNQSAQIQNK